MEILYSKKILLSHSSLLQESYRSKVLESREKGKLLPHPDTVSGLLFPTQDVAASLVFSFGEAVSFFSVSYNVGGKSPEKGKRKKRERRGKNIRMLKHPWGKTPPELYGRIQKKKETKTLRMLTHPCSDSKRGEAVSVFLYPSCVTLSGFSWYPGKGLGWC